ncbi:DUF2452 domain-containing protein [Neolewinella aurantiaca]|uniref:DUF2452 domain-containing protein n=1 Tax=Neolewinella aurantiaca TaxID=2602767 RepID=A0A5C7FKB3_9BACT|nr:DUF2452 domain-containing protein [Neolewinella aurantiaca]TXF91788.1 DUF2452 domain-containing protein [Neolewinella aurantiaca]
MAQKDQPKDTDNQRKTTPADDFINPIDADKIAENPGLLPYAHERGGATIKPMDAGKMKGLAMSSMYEQTDMQLDQIKAQIELLARQANEIQNRMTISERIYEAEMGIDPIIGRTYFLYRNKKKKHLLSMVSPAEWGPRIPYEYIATVKLLGDHTWDILERKEEI